MNYDNNNFNNFNNNNNHPPMPHQQSGNLYNFQNDINNSNNGYSNEDVTFTSSKKKRFNFIALLEFLIIVFLVCYIANDKGYIHVKFLDNLIPVKKEKQEEPNKTEEKPKTEETNITDTKLIADFKIRAYYMGNVGVSFDNLISPIFLKNTTSSDLTDEQKLQAIVMGALTVENRYESLVDPDEYKEVFPTIASEPANDISVIKFVDASFIESRYKMVFGEEPKNASIENKCPIIIYSDKYKKYYLNPYCGSGIKKESINQFSYRATTDGKKFHVYISVSTYRENDDKTVTVYKDPKLTKKYKDYASMEEYSNFEINASNYKEFSKYKITFIKKGSEYAFDSIEQIEEKETSEG